MVRVQFFSAFHRQNSYDSDIWNYMSFADKVTIWVVHLTMDILAYRAFLAPNFVEKASLILTSVEIMCGI